MITCTWVNCMRDDDYLYLIQLHERWWLPVFESTAWEMMITCTWVNCVLFLAWAMMLGSRASQLLCLRVAGGGPPAPQAPWGDSPLDKVGGSPVPPTPTQAGEMLPVPSPEDAGGIPTLRSCDVGTGGESATDGGICWGDVVPCWKTDWWGISSALMLSFEADSEMCMQKRCFRWHLLRTSSETDTNAEYQNNTQLTKFKCSQMNDWTPFLFN